MWHHCGAEVTLSPLRGRGKGWSLLRVSECHAEASPRVCRVNAVTVPQGPVRTNSSKFSLLVHGKCWAHPCSDSPPCSASPPHQDKREMGTSHHHHAWPLPHSPELQVPCHGGGQGRGRVLLPWVAGMRPQRMLQCLAPSQPSRAVGSVPRVCTAAPSPVAAFTPGAGEGLAALPCPT